MSAHLGFEVIRVEIHESKAQLKELLGREVSAFCWVEGDQYNYNQAAILEIKRAGYKIGFMTCSGVMDLLSFVTAERRQSEHGRCLRSEITPAISITTNRK